MQQLMKQYRRVCQLPVCLVVLRSQGARQGHRGGGPSQLPCAYGPLHCRGDKALAVVQQLLANPEAELEDIQLFSFRAIPSSKRLDIRLDKMTGGFSIKAGQGGASMCAAVAGLPGCCVVTVC